MNNGVYIVGKLNAVESKVSAKNGNTYVTAYIETDNDPRYGSSVTRVGMNVPEGKTSFDIETDLKSLEGKRVSVTAKVTSSEYGLNWYSGTLVQTATGTK